MSQQEEGGFHTSRQIFFFFFSLNFIFMINSLHVLQNVTHTAFLAFVFVCVLLQSYSKGYPDSCSPSGDNRAWRWKGGARELERKP